MAPIGPQHQRTAEHPYELIDLPMSDLNVDPKYQRAFKRAAANKIIKNFKPELMDPLVVNMRDDGEFWLVRGQHRKAALTQMFGEEATAPCIVYIGLSEEQEAEVFYTEDLNRRKLTPADRWYARVQAKDPVALDLIRVCAQSGYAIDPGMGPNNRSVVRCIGALETGMKGYGRVVIGSALAGIQQLNPDVSPPHGLVLGMIRFYGMYRSEPNFQTIPINKFLSKLGYFTLMNAAEARKRVDQCKIDTAICKELVLAFNKGKQEQNRLTVYEVKIEQARQQAGHRTRWESSQTAE